METLLIFTFFILGLIIGSFLNVVIFRYNTGATLRGRSICMSCEKKLCWYELIPLFSFFALGGRCFSCKSRIGAQYPVVEFTTGLLFALLFLKFQNVFYSQPLVFFATFIYYAVAFAILIVISTYDLKHKIIPDMLALLFGFLAFVGLFFFSSGGFDPHVPRLLEFLAGPLVAIPFALIWLISAGTAMGFGDAKLSLGLGWFLGLSMAASGLVVAFWSGAIIGIFLVAFSKKYGIKSEIPFAPFLILGAFLAFFLELHLFSVF